MRTRTRRRSARPLIVLAVTCAALVAFSGSAASAPTRAHANATITLDTLPIANAFPLDLGIKKGFFAAQGIDISKKTLQSGNDIVLALANHNGDIGYVGWVPAMIARTQGIALTAVAASDVEGTSIADNWQNIMVKGSSSIRTPADLAGKTIAVNALKGVGEVMIKAAKKDGVNPNSIKLVAIPFPAMRTALRNGQVDAIWAPEPFVTQALNLDGDRIVMAPGPVLGKFWPIGCYVAPTSWTKSNPGLARKFRLALNQSLTYAQSHPDEIRALLPAATRNIRLPIWSPVVDRAKLLQTAKYAKEFGVISTLPNFTQLVPSTVAGGKVLQAIVSNVQTTLRLDGRTVRTLPAGRYTIVVSDRSAKASFRLVGPGVKKKTSARGIGRSTWNVALRRGTYRYGSGRMRSFFRVR
jgi:NitT/TauT family transport system substrate-binding protein